MLDFQIKAVNVHATDEPYIRTRADKPQWNNPAFGVE